MKSEIRSRTDLFKSVPRFILLNTVIALAISIFLCSRCLFSLVGLYEIAPLFLISFVISSCLSMGGYHVEKFFEKRISWITSPIKRLVLTTFTYLLYSFIISFIFISMFLILNNSALQFSNFKPYDALPGALLSTVIALVIIAIFISRSWLLEWKKSAIESEQLRSELIENRYRALVEQLNPHFLFNSLNVLTNLLYEDPDKSAQFIRKLSHIYRYLLDVKQEELIELEKELDFAEVYLSLQKIRYEEKLRYDINVEEVKELYLPPLTLQLLLENAIKHNIVSFEQPLYIRVTSTKKSLIVENTLQPRKNAEKRQIGVGLENIKKRYSYLSNEQPGIIVGNGIYRVELPLLSVKK